MKDDKYKPLSRRQARLMAWLGLDPDPSLTVHQATRKINAAIKELTLPRGTRFKPLAEGERASTEGDQK